MSEQKDSKNQVVSDNDLADLLKEALSATTIDIVEAQDHVKMILEKITDPNQQEMALEMYAHTYVEALKVKGATRERHLKVIAMISNRLRIKEITVVPGDVPWKLKPQDVLKYLDDNEDALSSNNSE